MKPLIAFLIVVTTTTTAMGIVFIKEEEVQKKLSANKVVEVSKYNVKCLIPANSDCDERFASRSARAYIVKAGNKSKLYLTSEGLDDLKECANLTDAPDADASKKAGH